MSHPQGFRSRARLSVQTAMRVASRAATRITALAATLAATLAVNLAATLVVTLALPGVAVAERPWKVLEDSFEVSSSSVRMPDRSSGALSVLDCDGCRAGSYGFADDAQFSVAGTVVTYPEFLAAFRGGRYRSVYFDLRLESGEVSRVRIFP